MMFIDTKSLDVISPLSLKMSIPKEYTGLVLFTADWSAESCESARQICQTACSRSKIELIEIVENEANEIVCDSMEIELVPCLVRMERGSVVGRVMGANSKELLSFITSTSISRGSSIGNGTSSISNGINSASINNSTSTSSDLQALVNKSKLMLFIKGTPAAPQCGFTGQLIRLLSDHNLSPNLHYSTFNILSDQVVREELKKWAQWPTYPQVYWKGELLGGLDILKEMFANNQMDEIINELLQ